MTIEKIANQKSNEEVKLELEQVEQQLAQTPRHPVTGFAEKPKERDHLAQKRFELKQILGELPSL